MRFLFFILVLGLSSCTSVPYFEQAPTTPQNISPSPSVDIVNGAETEFIWIASQQVASYEFHIFNRSNADISSYYMRDLLPEAVCRADRCSVSVQIDLPVMKGHAWRVRAMNNVGGSNWTRSVFNVVE